MAEFTFSRFVYLDTCMYSHLAKNTQLWADLQRFLLANDLCLALSSANLAELADAQRLHGTLVDLLLWMPSAAIKPWDIILKEEVKAHPQRRTEQLLFYPFNQLMLETDGCDTLLGWFRGKELVRARRDQRKDARRILAVHRRLKGNFPPSKSGKYTRGQASDFATAIVMQWLADTHRVFLASFKDRVSDLDTEVFLSVRLFALVNFYKYYLGQREPRKLSDFGDEFHLFYLPYCRLAIMERDLCDVLNQIKGHQDVLDSTVVRDIDFFQEWSWEGAG